MTKYLVLFNLTGETVKRFIEHPSDRVAVIRGLTESAGGDLESYYWMFGEYDGTAIIVMPDSHTTAAMNLKAVSSGAFSHFETHELIEASDLAGIAERARRFEYEAIGD